MLSLTKLYYSFMPKSVKEKLGINIRKFRKLRNLNQEKLAELMDLSVIAISNMENGKALTSFKTLEQMAKILNVKLYEFFLFDDEVKEEVIYKKLMDNIKKVDIKNDAQKLMALYYMSESFLNNKNS